MRDCGECNLCCIVLDVPEINKVRGIQCPHSKKKVGCQIYNTRPQACIDFKCAWLQGEMDVDMIPCDQHIMIEKLDNVPVVLAMVEPNYYHVLRTIKPRLESTYSNNGIAVVADNGLAIVPEDMTPEDIQTHIVNVAKDMGYIV